MSELNANEENTLNGEGHKLEENDDDGSENKVVEYFSEITQEKKPKINDKLLIFYKLTKVDEELSEIDEERGDLPETISGLSLKVENSVNNLSNLKTQLENLIAEDSSIKDESKNLSERINRYDEQKFNVRSNKEYDDIMKAIDSGYEELEKIDKRSKDIEQIKEDLEVKIKESSEIVDELLQELEDRKTALQELNDSIAEEENDLKIKREGLMSKLIEKDRAFYERKNQQHRGEAIAIVRKSNCTGCYNSIPPQKEIEIRLAERVYTCESCGRILIAEELITTQIQNED
jgi:predicted  nucleic acid-binding Zn-ribbon protein